MTDQREILIVYDNKPHEQAIEYTFRLLMGILGLKHRVECLGEGQSPSPAPGQLVITYSAVPIHLAASRHIHIVASPFFGQDYLSPASLPAEPLPRAGDLPLIYQGCTSVPGHIRLGAQGVQTDIDIVASTFFMVSRYEEVVGTEPHDEHGRYPASACLAHREGFLQRPIVHEYAALLWRWLSHLDPSLVRYSPWGNRDLAVCVTHDVDTLRRYSYPPLLTVGRALKAGDLGRASKIVAEYGRVMLGRQGEPYDTFDYLLENECGHNLVPTFFFMAARYGLKDIRSQDYQLSDKRVQDIFRRLDQAGGEIGLHASYDAFDRPELLSQEKQALEQAIGHRVTGLRPHFLRFRAPQSWRLWEQTGFKYASSATFARQAGFRTGLCVPFRPFDILENREIALWEVPLTVMEGTLYEYQSLNTSQAGDVFNDLVTVVAEAGGAFVLLWHNSFLDELVHPGIRHAYETLIESLAARRVLGATIAQAIKRVEGQWSHAPCVR